MEILNNPALMGLIGVFVGALFSIVVSLINNKHSLKLINIKEEQRKKEMLRNDKKAAYFDFLLINQKILSFNLVRKHRKIEDIKRINEEIIYLNEKLKVEIELYFTEELKKDAYKVLGMCEPESEEEENFNVLRNELMYKITEAMRKDILM